MVFATKGQGGIEYMLSYGWAVLVVTIVLVIIFSTGILNFNTFTQSGCIPVTGYSCTDAILTTSGQFSALIGTPLSEIKITGAGCSGDQSAPISFTTPANAPIELTSQQTIILDFQCPLSISGVGQPFSGSIWIQYSSPTQSGIVSEIATISLPQSSSAQLFSTTSATTTTIGQGSGKYLTLFVNPAAISIGNSMTVEVTGGFCKSPPCAPPGFTAPVTYTWSNRGTCPNFKNPGNASFFLYTPSSNPTSCQFVANVVDSLGNTGGNVSSAIIVLPPPTTFATDPGNNQITSIVAADGNLYWSDNLYNIYSQPAGGGSPTLFAINGYDLAADSANLYWVNSSSNGEAIDYAPFNGKASTLVSGLPASIITSITVAGGYVVWGGYPGDVYEKPAPPSAGSAVLLTTDSNGIQAVTTDGVNVYWMDDKGNLKYMPIAGGTPTVIYSSGIAGGCGDSLYAPGGGVVLYTMPCRNVLNRTTTAGGTPTIILPKSYGISGASTLHGSTIFFGNSQGTIFSVQVSGGAATVVSPSVGDGWYVEYIAADNINVYWLTPGSFSRINKAPV